MELEDKTLNDSEVVEDNQDYDDTTTEGESQEESEGGESDSVTLTKAEREQLIADTRKEQDKRWKDRLKGVEGNEDVKKDTNKKEEVGDKALLDRLDRQDLRSEGIKDKEEQDIVLKYAKVEGLEVVDAVNSDIVKAALKVHRNKNSTPAPTTRTGNGQRDEVSYWASQTEKGKRAPTAEMRTKVREYLANQK